MRRLAIVRLPPVAAGDGAGAVAGDALRAGERIAHGEAVAVVVRLLRLPLVDAAPLESRPRHFGDQRLVGDLGGEGEVVEAAVEERKPARGARLRSPRLLRGLLVDVGVEGDPGAALAVAAGDGVVPRLADAGAHERVPVLAGAAEHRGGAGADDARLGAGVAGDGVELPAAGVDAPAVDLEAPGRDALRVRRQRVEEPGAELGVVEAVEDAHRRAGVGDDLGGAHHVEGDRDGGDGVGGVDVGGDHDEHGAVRQRERGDAAANAAHDHVGGELERHLLADRQHLVLGVEGVAADGGDAVEGVVDGVGLGAGRDCFLGHTHGLRKNTIYD